MTTELNSHYMEELYTQNQWVTELDGLGQVLANHGLGAKSSPLPDSLNKVLLKRGPKVIHWHIVMDTLSPTSCNRDCMEHKAKEIHYLTLCRKHLPIPDLDCHSPHSTELRLLTLWGLYTGLPSPAPQQRMFVKLCSMYNVHFPREKVLEINRFPEESRIPQLKNVFSCQHI